jgi:hypothetical protein
MHDTTFKLVEAYSMTAEHLQASPIGRSLQRARSDAPFPTSYKISKFMKVMRYISKAQDFPADEVYNFRERSRALVDRWSLLR